MNQTFNLNRFLKLFVKHTADNYKTYLMAFFVLLGVLFLSMGFAAYVSGGNVPLGAQVPFFGFVLLISGSIFTSIVFADLGNKKKAISMLTLPASHFEKYLIGWIYSFVIFQLLFIPAFYLVVIIINQLSELSTTTLHANQLLDIFSNDTKAYVTFYIYAVLHALCLLGSIFFEKHHFIKTAFTFFISMVILMFLNMKFMAALIGKKILNAVPLMQLSVEGDSQSRYNIELLEKEYIYVVAVVLIAVVILWICSFYRLKEKEV